MAKPPQHKICLLNIIDPLDPAWDLDRINADLDGLNSEEMRAHPVMAYRLGLSHFDLDAPGTVHHYEGETTACARDYLRPEVAPRVFMARRLMPLQVANCRSAADEVGRLWAFAMAVKAVGGMDGIAYHVEPDKTATDEQVQSVLDRVGYDVLVRVGQAVLDASRAPDPTESLHSGSPRGA